MWESVENTGFELESGLCAEELDHRLRRASRLADVGQAPTRVLAFSTPVE